MIEKMRTIKWRFVPICLLFALLPLIMRLVEFKIDPIYFDSLLSSTQKDWFFYYKGLGFIFLTIWMLFNVLLLRKKLTLHKDISFRLYAGCSLIFITFSMLSTFLSPYKDLAIVGSPTRFEGLGIMLCYVMVMWYTYAVFEDRITFKIIIIPFALIILFQTIIGLTQFLGYSIIHWKGIRDLIQPGEFESVFYFAPGTEPWFPKTKPTWSGSLGNSNYSGSFVSLAVPFFLVLTLSTKNIKTRLCYWFITFCGIFIAFACRSRGGLVGIIISLLLGVLCLIVFILKNKKNINWYELFLALFITFCLMFITNADSQFSLLFKDINKFFTQESTKVVTSTDIERIDLDTNQIMLITNKGILTVSYNDNALSFEDSNLEAVECAIIDNNLYVIDSSPYKGYAFESISTEEEICIRFYKNYDLDNNQSGTPQCGFKIDKNGNITLTNYWDFEPAIIETPPSIGFKGKERLGSGRGYIWSRSIPMLQDTMLLGYGPDMFMLEFPQHDFWGKMNILSTPFVGVDKPHNTYLQIWINQGFPAFLAFMILCGTYIIHSFKLYAFKKQYAYDEGLGLAFMLAIIAYLGASFFNDTTLSVTPLFWALLGAGMAYNVIYRKNKQEIDLKETIH